MHAGLCDQRSDLSLILHRQRGIIGLKLEFRKQFVDVTGSVVKIRHNTKRTVDHTTSDLYVREALAVRMFLDVLYAAFKVDDGALARARLGLRASEDGAAGARSVWRVRTGAAVTKLAPCGAMRLHIVDATGWSARRAGGEARGGIWAGGRWTR